MKRLLFIAFLSVCGYVSMDAQIGTKLEAEDASNENCKLIEDEKYSGGKSIHTLGFI